MNLVKYLGGHYCYILVSAKMCNIVLRRQRHGCLRNAYDLNTKGEKTRGDVEDV